MDRERKTTEKQQKQNGKVTEAKTGNYTYTKRLFECKLALAKRRRGAPIVIISYYKSNQ